ncbi:MAG: hypothetical protein JST65_01475 [Acidobacteria bacterium]|nr:hypothetical protein [Acidobacteriota bacterium]
MSQLREQLNTPVDSDILAAVRALAEREGRQVHALVDEALADLLEKRQRAQCPRDHVMAAYRSSHEKYSSLYKKLAE